MNIKISILAGLIVLLLLNACNLPQDLLPPTPGWPPTATLLSVSPTASLTPLATTPVRLADTPSFPTFTSTPLPPVATSTPTEVPSPTPTLSPTPITFPTVIFNTNANCRLGPSINYNQVTNFLKDRSTVAEGRNPDSSWLWVRTSGTNCWVNAATLKDPIDFSFLPVIPFQSLPEAPSRLTVAEIVCTGRISVTLRWPDVIGETGYRIYRNGIRLVELKADLTEYKDYPPRSASYLYEIESFNDVGVSVRYGQTIQGCR
ncbi:MAG: hypothetical protein DDG60_02105 [Anaerolineae bacterium]|nr:MAG: hypothetical protein DDG60_02105 [Anaerolineae bacterium]